MRENCKYKPKAIIFDWDNTLVDSWPVIQKSFNQTALSLGFAEFNLSEVKIKVGYALRHSFPMIFGDLAEKAQKTYREFYNINKEDSLKLLPFAQELLIYLKELNIKMFIVSNKIGDSVRKETKSLNINHYFQNIIGSLDTNFDKPNTAPVKLALENYKYQEADKKNILFIGDSLADYECAENIGFKSILVHSDTETKTKAKNAHIMNNLQELKALI